MKRMLLITFSLLQIHSTSGAELSDYKELSKKDIQSLESLYSEQAKGYEHYNLTQHKVRVPIFRTNAHHRAVQFMLQMYLKDRSNLDSPILHMDSHPDLGFAPAHGIRQINEDTIKEYDSYLTDISQVLLPAMQLGLTRELHMCMPPW